MKTSLLRIEVSRRGQHMSEAGVSANLRIVTEVSPFLNLPSVAEPGLMPSLSQIPSTSLGCEVPPKTIAPLIVGGPSSVTFS